LTVRVCVTVWLGQIGLKGERNMHILKRGLLGLSVAVVALSASAGGLLASQAGAQPTRGVEVVHGTQYSVNGGFGVGPWSGRGPISNNGVVTDIASKPGDPPNSNRHTLADPAGTFTVLTTGGNFIPGLTNPITCAFTARITGINVKVVAGTGAYRNLSGNLVANVFASGYQPRYPNGRCNFNADNSAFETDTVTAVGFVNLH
jgi:hypothetical protein